MSAQRTPGPFEVKAVNGRPNEEPGLYIVDGNGRDLMRGEFFRSEADAELIVQACNAHDELVAALRGLVETKTLHDMAEALQPQHPMVQEEYRKRRDAAWAAARAVLAKVGAA